MHWAGASCSDSAQWPVSPQSQATVQVRDGVMAMRIVAARTNHSEPETAIPLKHQDGLCTALPWQSSKDMQSFSATSGPFGRWRTKIVKTVLLRTRTTQTMTETTVLDFKLSNTFEEYRAHMNAPEQQAMFAEMGVKTSSLVSARTTLKERQ